MRMIVSVLSNFLLEKNCGIKLVDLGFILFVSLLYVSDVCYCFLIRCFQLELSQRTNSIEILQDLLVLLSVVTEFSGFDPVFD